MREIPTDRQVTVDAEELALVLRTLNGFAEDGARLTREIIVAIDRLGDAAVIVRQRARLSEEAKERAEQGKTLTSGCAGCVINGEPHRVGCYAEDEREAPKSSFQRQAERTAANVRRAHEQSARRIPTDVLLAEVERRGIEQALADSESTRDSDVVLEIKPEPGWEDLHR